jgi:hypothetical protein
VVITNVHGPDEAVFLAGHKLRGTIGWPPESGNLGLGVAITSYDGELTLGALADVELFPDARGLIELARTELDMLVDLCRSRSSGSPSP